MPKQSSMKLGSCIGYTSHLANHHLPTHSRSPYRSAKSNSKNFYENENYHLIIDCIDNGYQVSMNVLEYMQDYDNLLKKHIDNLISYSKKWTTKIENQPSISSYYTTKRAQLAVVGKPVEETTSLLNRHANIQKIIDTYRSQLENIYPSERLSISHKHHRRNIMKNLFKAAYSSLSQSLQKLTELREQEQSILNDPDISSKCNESSIETKRRLKEIKEQIAYAEKDYYREKDIYRMRAQDIYEQCRILEQQRIDLIKDTLIKFIEVAYSSEHAIQQREIHDQLKKCLKIEQNTIEDLDLWAQNYEVYDSIPSKMNCKHNDNDNDSISFRRVRMSPNNRTKNDIKRENVSCSTSDDDEQHSIFAATTPSTELKESKTTASAQEENNNCS